MFCCLISFWCISRICHYIYIFNFNICILYGILHRRITLTLSTIFPFIFFQFFVHFEFEYDHMHLFFRYYYFFIHVEKWDYIAVVRTTLTYSFAKTVRNTNTAAIYVYVNVYMWIVNISSHIAHIDDWYSAAVTVTYVLLLDVVFALENLIETPLYILFFT